MKQTGGRDLRVLRLSTVKVESRGGDGHAWDVLPGMDGTKKRERKKETPELGLRELVGYKRRGGWETGRSSAGG